MAHKQRVKFATSIGLSWVDRFFSRDEGLVATQGFRHLKEVVNGGCLEAQRERQ